MGRLIDADALNDNFKKTKIIEVFPNWKEMNPGTRSAVIRLTEKYREIILNAKTVDAVEVVRCRDCKKYREPFCMINDTNKDGWLVNARPNDFCSYGERRTDG